MGDDPAVAVDAVLVYVQEAPNGRGRARPIKTMK